MTAWREGYFRTHPVTLSLLELLPCRGELYLGILVVCPPQTPLSGEMTGKLIPAPRTCLSSSGSNTFALVTSLKLSFTLCIMGT